MHLENSGCICSLFAVCRCYLGKSFRAILQVANTQSNFSRKSKQQCFLFALFPRKACVQFWFWEKFSCDTASCKHARELFTRKQVTVFVWHRFHAKRVCGSNRLFNYFALKNSAKVSKTSFNSSGLVKNPSMPHSNAALRSSSKAFAVIAKMGTFDNFSFSKARIRRVAS